MVSPLPVGNSGGGTSIISIASTDSPTSGANPNLATAVAADSLSLSCPSPPPCCSSAASQQQCPFLAVTNGKPSSSAPPPQSSSVCAPPAASVEPMGEREVSRRPLQLLPAPSAALLPSTIDYSLHAASSPAASAAVCAYSPSGDYYYYYSSPLLQLEHDCSLSSVVPPSELR